MTWYHHVFLRIIRSKYWHLYHYTDFVCRFAFCWAALCLINPIVSVQSALSLVCVINTITTTESSRVGNFSFNVETSLLNDDSLTFKSLINMIAFVNCCHPLGKWMGHSQFKMLYQTHTIHSGRADEMNFSDFCLQRITFVCNTLFQSQRNRSFTYNLNCWI